MGGQSSSTPQNAGSQLQQLFMQGMQAPGGGYQQPNQVAPIAAPQYGGALTPSPEQAAAATRARILARTPMAAPKGAPTVNKPYIPRGGEGGSRGHGT